MPPWARGWVLAHCGWDCEGPSNKTRTVVCFSSRSSAFLAWLNCLAAWLQSSPTRLEFHSWVTLQLTRYGGHRTAHCWCETSAEESQLWWNGSDGSLCIDSTVRRVMRKHLQVMMVLQVLMKSCRIKTGLTAFKSRVCDRYLLASEGFWRQSFNNVGSHLSFLYIYCIKTSLFPVLYSSFYVIGANGRYIKCLIHAGSFPLVPLPITDSWQAKTMPLLIELLLS